MSVLSERMIEDMQLRGLAVRTQETYLQSVRQLAKYYHKPPDQIDDEELRQYFLYLKNDRPISRSTCTIALCGIKFFYVHTLKRSWHTLAFMRPDKEKKLPVVLSVEEVDRILRCVHQAHYRVCLTTIYTCTHRRCGVPVACVCWKVCTCRSRTSTASARCCTSARQKAASIATFPCRMPAW